MTQKLLSCKLTLLTTPTRCLIKLPKFLAMNSFLLVYILQHLKHMNIIQFHDLVFVRRFIRTEYVHQIFLMIDLNKLLKYKYSVDNVFFNHMSQLLSRITFVQDKEQSGIFLNINFFVVTLLCQSTFEDINSYYYCNSLIWPPHSHGYLVLINGFFIIKF